MFASEKHRVFTLLSLCVISTVTIEYRHFTFPLKSVLKITFAEKSHTSSFLDCEKNIEYILRKES